MKRLFFVISFIFCGIFFTVDGQTSKFEIGVEGGPGATFLYGNTVTLDELKPIFGGYAGVLFQYHFSNVFSIKTGCSYERKGANFKIESWDYATPKSNPYLPPSILLLLIQITRPIPILF